MCLKTRLRQRQGSSCVDGGTALTNGDDGCDWNRRLTFFLATENADCRDKQKFKKERIVAKDFLSLMLDPGP